jgi:nitronate monooxygenase
MWPDRRILELLHIELPIVQAPMAGAQGAELAIAVSQAGGLGSLPCAMLSPEQARTELGIIRQRTSRPINVNFFSHKPPQRDLNREIRWKQQLAPYYAELGVDPPSTQPGTARLPFDAAMCELVEEFKPEVVSFHFGMPERGLLDRVRATGARIFSSATTVEEARQLADQGCDAIIAQGNGAGGHRGMFVTDNVASQAGTFALVPQVVDAVSLPVIAAGGIADARGIVAAFALGASAVQIGTAFLLTPEARISPLHRAALKRVRDDSTVLTNVFTGRPARGILNRVIREVGPISPVAPAFPLAADAIGPLRSKSESLGREDFVPMWSGQAGALARELPAADLTRDLATEALRLMGRLGQAGKA